MRKDVQQTPFPQTMIKLSKSLHSPNLLKLHIRILILTLIRMKLDRLFPVRLFQLNVGRFWGDAEDVVVDRVYWHGGGEVEIEIRGRGDERVFVMGWGGKLFSPKRGACLYAFQLDF